MNRHRVCGPLGVLLCIVLVLQCGAAQAFALPAMPQPYTVIYDEVDEFGDRVPEYVLDAQGRRVDVSAKTRVRAMEDDDLPTSYDLRGEGIITSVKYQAGSNSCWAFSAIACMESTWIRQGYGTIENTDFSEAHLAWFGNHSLTPDTSDPTFGDGYNFDNPFRQGGNWRVACSTLMRGTGAQLESNAPWIETYVASEMMQMAQDESERYVSFARMWKSEHVAGLSAIKRKIMQNGPMVISYYDDANTSGTTNYNRTYFSYYQDEKTTTNHAVSIVGWDDDFPKTHFNKEPPTDGAWLVKGTWSALYGDEGYFWLSYADTSIGDAVSVVSVPADIYENIYQYDGAATDVYFTGASGSSMANIFTSKGVEQLTHVAFYSNDINTLSATAEVYVDDGGFVLSDNNPTKGMRKVTSATVTANDVSRGFRTLELSKPVLLSAGQKFAVVITFTNPSGGSVLIPAEGGSSDTKMHAGNAGSSFMYLSDYRTWFDTNALGSADYNNVPVKAMTKSVDCIEPTLIVTNPPAKTTYQVGETLDTTGLALAYIDDSGAVSQITSGYVCTPTTFAAAGTQTVSVRYAGLAATFSVSVTSQPADPDASAMFLSGGSGKRGTTVDVTVAVRRNPGIVSTRIFIDYDPAVLTLIGVSNGSIFAERTMHAAEDLTQNPFEISWSDPLCEIDCIGNGTLATLRFAIRGDAPEGTTPVTLRYDSDATYNIAETAQTFLIESGFVTVYDPVSGDANGDGVTDLRDVAVIRRYLADGWSGLAFDTAAADVNADRSVDLRDVALILRYLAGGWDVVLV